MLRISLRLLGGRLAKAVSFGAKTVHCTSSAYRRFTLSLHLFSIARNWKQTEVNNCKLGTILLMQITWLALSWNKNRQKKGYNLIFKKTEAYNFKIHTHNRLKRMLFINIMTKHHMQIFRASPFTNYKTTVEQWKMRCRTLKSLCF